MISALNDFTAPYSRVESWLYDAIIAPSVRQFDDALLGRYLPALRTGARVLEVGCGGGQLLAKVAGLRPDLQLTGVDLSREQVARARKRTAACAERVTCQEGNALDLPFAAGQFDSVVSVASIKHWPDPARGLAECARVLRPGGLLFVVEVDRGCKNDDVRRFVHAWRLPTPLRPLARTMFRTVVAGRSFDLDDTRALAAGLGWEGVQVERLPDVPAWLLSGRRPAQP